MKKLTIILIGIMCILISHTLLAQNQLKIGHINSEKIIAAMPESDSAKISLENDTYTLGKMLEDMQVEYSNLLETYQKNMESYSQIIKRTKETELIEMQDKIQNFRQNASQQLQLRSNELFQPIYDKVQNAIDKVATKEGFTYILDKSKGTVVFTAKSSQDVSPLVLTELGITL